MLDNIEIGLVAFDELNKFMPRFPGFDLIRELEVFYDEKNKHVKDCIKLGAAFVKSLDAELSQLDTSIRANSKVNKEDVKTGADNNKSDDRKWGQS